MLLSDGTVGVENRSGTLRHLFDNLVKAEITSCMTGTGKSLNFCTC